jgi:hypothetical protein
MKSKVWNGIKAVIGSKASILLRAMQVVLAFSGPFAISALALPPAYVVSAGITGNGVFGIVNPQSGAFQPIGPVEPDGYFGLARGPHGSLISLTYTANLVSIDPETGVPTEIGPTGLDSCLVPNPSCPLTTAFSLGAFGRRIFATDWENDVYLVDPQSGTATLLTSNSGLPSSPFVPGSQNADGTYNFADEAIWESGGRLYATYDAWTFDPVTFSVVDVVVSPTLYRIDPATGQATAIGPTALAIGGVYDADGVDYAFDDLTGQILRLDLSSGNTTPVRNFASAAGVIQGAVPVSAQSLKELNPEHEHRAASDL